MKCKNPKCGNNLTGRQREFCSDRCRMAVKRTPEPEQTKVEQQTRTDQIWEECVTCENMVDENGAAACDGQAILQHSKCNPDKYATRTNPEKLNWGPILGAVDLKIRGFVANRVSIPGDWDYEGVA